MRRLSAAVLAALLLGSVAASAAEARTVRLGEFRLSEAKLDRIRDRWVDRLLERYEPGTWAPAKVELTDADLRDMGLPPRRKLAGKRFPVPTAVYPDGRMVPLGTPRDKRDKPSGGGGSSGGGGGGGTASSTTGITYAGTGFFGIRPGAWLLLLDDGVGWCSMAHLYGSPGSYQVSTAGHCGKNGDTGTVIGAAVINGQPVAVLLSFGKFVSSTGDGGIGRDWAKLSIDAPYQSLATPTMAFWGGPRGVYTNSGDVAAVQWNGKGLPQIQVTPDPFLVQQVVHYGHGIGVGAGGTPRSGSAITWRDSYFTFFGAITPGDSGSGTNTLTGDTVGANMEAAGINTHIYVDSSLRTGLGLMAGSRATKVGTPANGQIVPYPAPAPGLP